MKPTLDDLSEEESEFLKLYREMPDEIKSIYLNIGQVMVKGDKDESETTSVR